MKRMSSVCESIQKFSPRQLHEPEAVLNSTYKSILQPTEAQSLHDNGGMNGNLYTLYSEVPPNNTIMQCYQVMLGSLMLSIYLHIDEML